MSHLFTTIVQTLTIISLLAFFHATSLSAQKPPSAPLHLDLAVSFDVDAKMLYGTSRIKIDKNQGLELLLTDLNVTAALLSSGARENAPIDVERGDIIRLEAAEEPRTLLISYEKRIEDSFENIISTKAVVLSANWHPIPQSKATFSLSAQVPKGWTALSQSDKLIVRGADKDLQFSFSQPVYGLTFIAAPYVKNQKTVRDGLQVHTLFFEEDRDLAESYLEAAAGYIKHYEEIIGPFPYNHYVIAENIMPTGYGFPTFTLLGQQVIRLPFIKQTSLGHEILHSWFGNSIDISADSGNWAEGLTTYLADMFYRSQAGQGSQSRKEAIQHYQSYIDESTPSLDQFRGAGHERRANQAIRAVGYQKSAMLFHELSIRVGEDVFYRGIKDFYRRYKGEAASWQNLQMVFEELSGQNLKVFFSQRLSRNDLPLLGADNISIKQGSSDTSVSLTITQDQSPPYELLLPVSIVTSTGARHFQSLISEPTTRLSYQVDSTPLEIILDPEYDLMRRLSPAEDKPLWSALLGAENCLVVLPDVTGENRYSSLVTLTDHYGCQSISSSDLKQEDIENHSVIFLGTSNNYLRSTFGSPAHPTSGFIVDVRRNPFNAEHAAALISSSSSRETEAAVSRLSHYGKYSYLHFEQGRITEKRVPESTGGIRLRVEDQPSGVAVADLSPLSELTTQLSSNRVVYVGETHTSRPDHLLQMMLIEALHQQKKDLAIGMEMFPRSSQAALDRYISDPSFSEAEFLKESRYYEVWGYDYRLFRPIFAFAKKHKIPVIGLNIDRQIVSSVFKSGSIDNLTAEQKEFLPSEMRLDLDGYVERLAQTFEMHGQANLAEGKLSGFLQAQALWDETMAESISLYLKENPTRSMIVLAGSQHTRNDSGIPPRVAARLDVAQASVVNRATTRLSAAELAKTADYLFLLEADEFKPQGKIGIVLEEKDSGEETMMRILEVNPQSNAKTAGIQKDDILIFIDELAIHTMDDVRLALLDKAVGETIRIAVLRGGDKSGERLEMEVALYNPSRPAGHP